MWPRARDLWIPRLWAPGPWAATATGTARAQAAVEEFSAMGLSWLEKRQILGGCRWRHLIPVLTLPRGLYRHPRELDLKSSKDWCLKLQHRYRLCQEAFLDTPSLAWGPFFGFPHAPTLPCTLPWEFFFFTLKHTVLRMFIYWSANPPHLKVGSLWLRLESHSSLCPSLAQGFLMLADDEWALRFPSLLEGRRPLGIHDLNGYHKPNWGSMVEIRSVVGNTQSTENMFWFLGARPQHLL